MQFCRLSRPVRTDLSRPSSAEMCMSKALEMQLWNPKSMHCKTKAEVSNSGPTDFPLKDFNLRLLNLRDHPRNICEWLCWMLPSTTCTRYELSKLSVWHHCT